MGKDGDDTGRMSMVSPKVRIMRWGHHRPRTADFRRPRTAHPSALGFPSKANRSSRSRVAEMEVVPGQGPLHDILLVLW